MQPVLVSVLALLAAAPAAMPGPVSTPIASIGTTWSGQPFAVPPGSLQVIVQTTDIPAGGGLGVHKHPYPRFVYVLAGRLEVTNDDTHETRTFEAGAFVVEVIGQWHHARVVGDQPVKLLVIDQVPPGAANLVMKP